MSKRSQANKTQLQPQNAEPVASGVAIPASRRVLVALVGAYILLTSLLIIFIPINGAPDEDAHVQYVQHLAVRGQLPIFEPYGATHPGYEFHQPPLYYALCVPLWNATGAGVQYYMCRLVSLLCGVLTLVLIWRAVETLFPNDPQLPVLATGLAALWPLHQGVGASAANGALACLWCSAIYCSIARAAQREWHIGDSVLLGVLVGCGLLTATSSLVMLFVAAGAAWHLTTRSRAQQPEGLSPVYAAAAVVGVALLIGGWWLMRNQRLYGDALALGIFNQAFSKTSPGPAVFLAHGISLPTYLYAVVAIMFFSAWGIFGGPNTAGDMLNPFGIHGPRPGALPGIAVGIVCLIATVVALIGLIRFVLHRTAEPASTRLVLGWWCAGWILVFLSWVQFNLHYYQAQARYLHPALLPMALFLALGWKQMLWRKGQEWILWLSSAAFGAVLILLTLWNVGGWHTLK